MIDDEINPGMVGLFSLIESRLAADRERGLLHDGLHLRRAAVATWMAAHGLVATLGLLDSGNSKLLHDVDDMLDELCGMLTRGVYRESPDPRSASASRPRRRANRPRSG